jgi:hypothetical protein
VDTCTVQDQNLLALGKQRGLAKQNAIGQSEGPELIRVTEKTVSWLVFAATEWVPVTVPWVSLRRNGHGTVLLLIGRHLSLLLFVFRADHTASQDNGDVRE